MQITLLLIVLVGGSPFWACGRVLAQASFECRNFGTDQTGKPFRTPVYDWMGNLLAGWEWRAELYGGATPDSLIPLVSWGSNARVITPFFRPGYFAHSGVVLAGVPGGSWVWLQVKVWDVGLGATYEEVSARRLGGYGQSELFYQRGGNPIQLDLPAPLTGLRSFSVLEPVPEPSTGALLGLGLAGLWRWRRRS
jgi:hypothetical protein